MEAQKLGSNEVFSELKAKPKSRKKKKMQEVIDEGGYQEKELLDEMDDEEFLTSLCNTGQELKQSGRTVEELKVMVIKREVAIVSDEDRALYNTLPEVLRIAFDQCKVNMEYIKKRFTHGNIFDPNFGSC